jgi:hypothetical protein
MKPIKIIKNINNWKPRKLRDPWDNKILKMRNRSNVSSVLLYPSPLAILNLSEISLFGVQKPS